MARSHLGAPRLFVVGHYGGHRREYMELLAPLFRLTPTTGKVKLRNILPLLRARSVLFGTIEDHYIGFVIVAFLRSLVGLRTVGLFLRPQTCFKSDGSLRWNWKGRFFGALRKVKGVSVGTIIPFDFAPHYARVASFGVMDPHMWDKGNCSSCAQDTVLANNLAQQARGRRIIAFLGTVTPIKGIEFLMALLSRPEWPEDRLFVVIAGKVAPDLAGPLRLIPSLRCLVIDRVISDIELDTLYSCCDLIWACYEPGYDQASGIFGRSVQFGKSAVVRRGSQIDLIATRLGLATIRLDFGEADSATEALAHAPHCSTDTDLALLAEWRGDFVKTIEALF